MSLLGGKKKEGLSVEQRKSIEEETRVRGDVSEEYDDVQDNLMYQRGKVYPSDILPQDFYQYKKMRLIPEADTDFKGLIDKDLVLGHIGGEKPKLSSIRFTTETIELVKNVFVVERPVPVIDNEGNFVSDKEGQLMRVNRMVFDESFEPIVRILQAGIKTDLAGSRAMGTDREAVLDITQSLRKDIQRKKEQERKTFGI